MYKKYNINIAQNSKASVASTTAISAVILKPLIVTEQNQFC